MGKTMTITEKRERRKKIAMGIKAGRSSAVMMRRFGVTEMTIRRACRENGVEFRTNGK